MPSPGSEFLGRSVSGGSSWLPSCSARLPLAQLVSCRPRVATHGWGTEFLGGRPQRSRRLLAEMPGKKAHKSAQPSPTRAREEIELEVAIQLRRIGDKLNFRQKLLNLIYKLFRSGT